MAIEVGDEVTFAGSAVDPATGVVTAITQRAVVAAIDGSNATVKKGEASFDCPLADLSEVAEGARELPVPVTPVRTWRDGMDMENHVPENIRLTMPQAVRDARATNLAAKKAEVDAINVANTPA